MKIGSTTVLKDLAAYEKDKSMPDLGLIKLSDTQGYSYLVPMSDSFYANPAFKIPRASNTNLESVLISDENPVFSKLNPTWMSHAVEVIERLGTRCVFYDIGAFVGSVTIHLANLCGNSIEYVAFEPNPVNRRILSLNLQLNGLLGEVCVEEMACSNSDGIELFSVWPTSAISGRLSIKPASGTLTFPVQTISFESYMASNPVPNLAPLILKIDTEGHEWRVLQGVGQYWSQILCCVVEYWPSEDLSYEEYLLDKFYVLKIRSTMFSEAVPYEMFESAASLKEYGDECIRTSHNVDVLLIPRAGHSACSMLLNSVSR